jgi:hypothetical protein
MSGTQPNRKHLADRMLVARAAVARASFSHRLTAIAYNSKPHLNTSFSQIIDLTRVLAKFEATGHHAWDGRDVLGSIYGGDQDRAAWFGQIVLWRQLCVLLGEMSLDRKQFVDTPNNFLRDRRFGEASVAHMKNSRRPSAQHGASPMGVGLRALSALS